MRFKLLGYTIDISKNKRKRTKGYAAKAWKKADVDKALLMDNEGYSREEIAADLGRTVQAVNAKLWKVRK
jgi:hypothetical protein